MIPQAIGIVSSCSNVTYQGEDLVVLNLLEVGDWLIQHEFISVSANSYSINEADYTSPIEFFGKVLNLQGNLVDVQLLSSIKESLFFISSITIIEQNTGLGGVVCEVQYSHTNLEETLQDNQQVTISGVEGTGATLLNKTFTAVMVNEYVAGPNSRYGDFQIILSEDPGKDEQTTWENQGMRFVTRTWTKAAKGDELLFTEAPAVVGKSLAPNIFDMWDEGFPQSSHLIVKDTTPAYMAYSNKGYLHRALIKISKKYLKVTLIDKITGENINITGENNNLNIRSGYRMDVLGRQYTIFTESMINNQVWFGNVSNEVPGYITADVKIWGVSPQI